MPVHLASNLFPFLFCLDFDYPISRINSIWLRYLYIYQSALLSFLSLALPLKIET